MKIEPQQIKAFLLDSELVGKADLEKAEAEAAKNGKKIENILLANGKITEDEIARLKAYILGIPFINLEGEVIAPAILKIIPESIARAHNIVAFRKNDNNLEVAMVDPEDLRTIAFIEKTMPSIKILPRLTTPESIKNVLGQYQKTLETEFKDIIQSSDQTEIKHIKEGDLYEGKEEIKKAAEDVPIIKIVDTLLKHAILQDTSDIHIEPLEKEVIVRYRVDGILHDVMTLPISTALGIVARIKVLSNLKLDEHRLPQDGRFKIETNEFKYSVRVSVLPVFNGEKIVMRLLAENTKSASLDKLGFSGKVLKQIQDNLQKSSGMILITGPTGSGKTTTLYAMMEILNTPEVNISTVEDPIE